MEITSVFEQAPSAHGPEAAGQAPKDGQAAQGTDFQSVMDSVASGGARAAQPVSAKDDKGIDIKAAPVSKDEKDAIIKTAPDGKAGQLLNAVLSGLVLDASAKTPTPPAESAREDDLKAQPDAPAAADGPKDEPAKSDAKMEPQAAMLVSMQLAAAAEIKANGPLAAQDMKNADQTDNGKKTAVEDKGNIKSQDEGEYKAGEKSEDKTEDKAGQTGQKVLIAYKDLKQAAVSSYENNRTPDKAAGERKGGAAVPDLTGKINTEAAQPSDGLNMSGSAAKVEAAPANARIISGATEKPQAPKAEPKSPRSEDDKAGEKAANTPAASSGAPANAAPAVAAYVPVATNGSAPAAALEEESAGAGSVVGVTGVKESSIMAGEPISDPVPGNAKSAPDAAGTKAAPKNEKGARAGAFTDKEAASAAPQAKADGKDVIKADADADKTDNGAQADKASKPDAQARDTAPQARHTQSGRHFAAIVSEEKTGAAPKAGESGAKGQAVQEAAPAFEGRKEDPNPGDPKRDGANGTAGPRESSNAPRESAGAADKKAEPVQARQSVNRAEVYERINDGLKISIAQGAKDVKISLSPEHLGGIEIKMNVDNGVVKAQVLVDSSAVKGMLESDSGKLKEIFSQQGLTLDKYSVELNMQGFSMNDGNRAGKHLWEMFNEATPRPGHDSGTASHYGGGAKASARPERSSGVDLFI